MNQYWLEEQLFLVEFFLVLEWGFCEGELRVLGARGFLVCVGWGISIFGWGNFFIVI